MPKGLLAAATLLLSCGALIPATAAGHTRKMAVVVAPASQPAASQPASAPAPLVEELLVHRAFRLTMPVPHQGIILAASARWRVDPFLLYRLLDAESGLDCTQVNRRGKKPSYAAGCGQFTRTGIKGLNTIRKLRGDLRPFTRADAFDPVEGIHAAAELLGYWIQRFGVRVGVESYNGNVHRKPWAAEVLRRTERDRTRAGLPPRPERRLSRPPRPLQSPLPVS